MIKLFSRYPWHASCVINWSIPQTCDTVKSLIIKQLKEWEVISIFLNPILFLSLFGHALFNYNPPKHSREVW